MQATARRIHIRIRWIDNRVVLSEKEVTNRTLAEKLDVSEMTVSRWVTNKIQPSMSQFIEISKVLNVDIRELVEVDPTEISESNTCDA